MRSLNKRYVKVGTLYRAARYSLRGVLALALACGGLVLVSTGQAEASTSLPVLGTITGLSCSLRGICYLAGTVSTTGVSDIFLSTNEGQSWQLSHTATLESASSPLASGITCAVSGNCLSTFSPTPQAFVSDTFVTSAVLRAEIPLMISQARELLAGAITNAVITSMHTSVTEVGAYIEAEIQSLYAEGEAIALEMVSCSTLLSLGVEAELLCEIPLQTAAQDLFAEALALDKAWNVTRAVEEAFRVSNVYSKAQSIYTNAQLIQRYWEVGVSAYEKTTHPNVSLLVSHITTASEATPTSIAAPFTLTGGCSSTGVCLDATSTAGGVGALYRVTAGTTPLQVPLPVGVGAITALTCPGVTCVVSTLTKSAEAGLYVFNTVTSQWGEWEGSVPSAVGTSISCGSLSTCAMLNRTAYGIQQIALLNRVSGVTKYLSVPKSLALVTSVILLANHHILLTGVTRYKRPVVEATSNNGQTWILRF
jgi:hypothetical protein